MGLFKAPGDDDRLLFQIVLLHRLEVAVAPLGVRRAVPPSTCTIRRCPRLLLMSSSSSSVWGFSSCHDKTPESRRFRGGGGGWGIRTPEGLHPTRFPSVRHRPLGESSRRSTRRHRVQRERNISDRPSPGPARGGGICHAGPVSPHRPRVDAPQASGTHLPGQSSSPAARPRPRAGGGGGGSQPGAGSGSLSLGPSCGVIQRIPQDRKVARVSRLWRVREGSLRARAVKRAACCARLPEGDQASAPSTSARPPLERTSAE